VVQKISRAVVVWSCWWIAGWGGIGTVGNMKKDALRDSVADLLGRFGVVQPQVMDEVLEAGRRVLDERGHSGDVIGLRHGELIIECAGPAARMLRWDSDQVLKAIEKQYPGSVEKIVIKTKRGMQQ
jgi:hypothetical protein